MDRKPERPEADRAAQLDRFKETARALGCDEDEAAFDEKLKVVASRKMRGRVKVPVKPATGSK